MKIPRYIQKKRDASSKPREAEKMDAQRKAVRSLHVLSEYFARKEEAEKATAEFDKTVRWPSESRAHKAAIEGTIVAKCALFVTILGTAAAVAAGIWTFGQLSVMRSQLTEMKAEHRAWVKVKLAIVNPLTFGVGGTMAKMTLGNNLENVGDAVALDVNVWEDIIPLDPGGSTSSALARQTQYCNANRHPQGYIGETLFPNDPVENQSVVGATMTSVSEAAANQVARLKGQIAFAVVGCVFYRSAGEPTDSPTHQTRFIYILGTPVDGAVMPYMPPINVANNLKLVEMPTRDGRDAD